MKRLASLFVVACVLAMAAQVSAAELPPVVKATLTSDTLLLSFPAGTIKESVSFKCHGLGVTRRMIAHRHKAFTWTSDTELSVNIKALHCRRACSCCKAKACTSAELWVWGQLQSGEALLQKITVTP